MGQLLLPAMIGAGVGAVGGAVSGQNPLKTALLGAGLGAGGAGLMGSGSGLLSGLKGVEAAVPSLGSGGYATLGQSAIAPVIAPVASSTAGALPFGSTEFISPYTKEGIVNFADGTTSTFAPDYLSAGVNYGNNAPNFTPVLGKSSDAIGGGYNPSFFGRINDTLGNPFANLTNRDKLDLGLQGASLFNQPQPVTQAPQRQLQPGSTKQPMPNTNQSSNLDNVAPNITGSVLDGIMARIPLTDEEKLRLQMLAQQGYRG